MAAIRHSLQKEVCDLADEQLMGVLHVTKPGKKKKTSFLCAVITKEKPVNALVHQVCKLSMLLINDIKFSFYIYI